MKRRNHVIYSLAIAGFFANTAYASTQLIIKFKPPATRSTKNLSQQQLRTVEMQPINSNRMHSLSMQAGIELYDVKPLAIGGRVITTKKDLSPPELKNVISRLETDPDIEYVEEDIKGELASTPTTGLLNPLQWDIAKSSIFDGYTYYGSNFTGKDGTSNTQVPSNYGEGVTVAVVDTGYIPHPDFINSLIPLMPGSKQYGYQFISSCGGAGSCKPGESQDTPIPFHPDALDRGISGQPYHGTHIIGTIVGNGYNVSQSKGVTGGAPGAKVVPVLVAAASKNMKLFLSDVINGMLWAGGEHVIGADDNVNPAKVINLSLGFMFACPKSLEQSIEVLHKKNVNLVFAAMNSAIDSKEFAPANCPNSNHTIIVAAVGPTEQLAYYSDYGDVTISAAGGIGLSQSRYGQIYSTSCMDESINIGCNFENGNNFGWKYQSGTSMAAPHVTAAIAALLSKDPTLTPTQIIDILQKTATPYQGNNNCSEAGCVTNGILNTDKAMKSILKPL